MSGHGRLSMTTNYEHTMRCIDEYLKYAPDSDAAEVHYTAALDWLTGSYEEDHTADEVRGMDVKAALDALIERRRAARF